MRGEPTRKVNMVKDGCDIQRHADHIRICHHICRHRVMTTQIFQSNQMTNTRIWKTSQKQPTRWGRAKGPRQEDNRFEEGKPDLTIPTTVSVKPEETNTWEDSMVTILR